MIKLCAALLISISAYGVHIIDAAGLPMGRICILTSTTSRNDVAVMTVSCLSPQGEVLWSSETPPVRSDAAQGLLAAGANGNIQCAVQFGEGYTDILLRTYSEEGTILGSDTISGECYDAPQVLMQMNDSFILAWDSWSDERGLHQAVINQSGEVASQSFVAETANPLDAAMGTNGTTAVLGVSPLVAAGEVLFGIDGESNVTWSLGADRGIPDDATRIRDIAVEQSGGFVVLWDNWPTGDDNLRYIITVHEPGGEVLEKRPDTVWRPCDLFALELLESGEMIQAGYFAEDGGFHVTKTDLEGNITGQITLESDFVFEHVKQWNTDGYILFGSQGLNTLTDEGILVFSL